MPPPGSSSPHPIFRASSNLALWRRFDLILPFPAPTKSELSAFAKALVAKYKLPASAQATRRALRTKSYAEAERLIQAEARTRILANCEEHHAKRRGKR